MPYVEAAVAGLTKLSRRNFKLASWPVGFGTGDAPVPLSYGDFILLDGTIRQGRETHSLAWSDLTWDGGREVPKYRSGALRNLYLILRVQRSS